MTSCLGYICIDDEKSTTKNILSCLATTIQQAVYLAVSKGPEKTIEWGELMTAAKETQEADGKIKEFFEALAKQEFGMNDLESQMAPPTNNYDLSNLLLPVE